MLPDTAASKVTAAHLSRRALLYLRQSSLKQVIHNTESALRQYHLRGKATALGWAADQVTVIDIDQGQSGASAADREGFQQLVAEVSPGRAGIVLGLECSRLARNNALFRYRNKAFCSARGIMPRTVVPFLVKKVSFLAESA
jgi:DNA invertase Pin-like site-specific DNA recombinase